MDDIKTMLDDEIKDRIQNLKTQIPGNEEDNEAVDNLVKLHNLRMEELNLQQNRENEAAARKETALDRWVKAGTDLIGTVLPLAFYAAWMKKGFKFEETGTFTSKTFQGLIHNFRPKK